MSISGFHPVVPAGGAGTRLWPLSRAGAPKFFHDLTGSGRSLIQATYDRLAPLSETGVMFVTGRPHVAELAAQLPDLAASDVIAEPSPRDSMAAIGLAAAIVRERYGDQVIGSFAADHVIRDVSAFHRTVAEAVEVAQAGAVTTIGIPAAEPSTAYGYIEQGAGLDVPGAPSVHQVASFTEKPDPGRAAAYLATGRYRWNAGMFVVRTDVLLGHLARLHPQLHAGLIQIAAAWDTERRDEVADRIWPTLAKIAIDYAIAEPVAAEGGVAVVSGDFGWDDVGDWRSVAGLLGAQGSDGGGAVLGDGREVLARDAADCLSVPAAGKQVVLLGVEGLVVVDTPDALLVAGRDHAQDVKAIVDELRAAGRTELL